MNVKWGGKVNMDVRTGFEEGCSDVFEIANIQLDNQKIIKKLPKYMVA
jgi:hypothetical protein